MYRAIRFPQNPIIHSLMDDQIGNNINGPSLIRVPEWIPSPLGKYYLYFAHHRGTYIRMAYADHLQGPWTIHKGGVLNVQETCCGFHIASPDIHLCHTTQQIIMYFHGDTAQGQRTFRAISRDGIYFKASSEVLGPFYFRVFPHEGAWYAIAKTPSASGGGFLLRSCDGIQPFEQGPEVIPRQRHVALLKKENELQIFCSRVEDCPERILVATMSLGGDWKNWKPSEPQEILRPEMEYEGGHLPQRPSLRGAIHGPVCELRDPAVFQENERIYLMYTGAGESSICGAELIAL